MARDYGRIKVSIWSDPDFLALPLSAQHAYFMLLSQPRLSYVGVIDYLPGRLATLCPDHDELSVDHAVKELEANRFVIADRATSELLIRSYIRHDPMLSQPNMTKAMARDYSSVLSPGIRAVIDDELARCYLDDKKLGGWRALKEESPQLFARVTGKGSPKGSGKGSAMGSPKGYE